MLGQATRHQGYVGRPVMPSAILPCLAGQPGSKTVQTQGCESPPTPRKKLSWVLQCLSWLTSRTEHLVKHCH
eukprot:10735317-Karenia_brevis.AAC.1